MPNLSDLIKQIVQSEIPPMAEPCEVLSVDISNSTCEVQPLSDDAELFDVPLMAHRVGNAGFIPIPKVGSVVYVQYLDKNNAFITLSSELDSLLIQIDSITLKIDANGIQLNGTDFGGLMKIADTVGKLNNIESDLNNLKNIFSTWVPVSGDGGGALKTLLTSYNSSIFTPTQVSELENDKVKHGSN